MQTRPNDPSRSLLPVYQEVSHTTLCPRSGQRSLRRNQVEKPCSGVASSSLAHNTTQGCLTVSRRDGATESTCEVQRDNLRHPPVTPKVHAEPRFHSWPVAACGCREFLVLGGSPMGRSLPREGYVRDQVMDSGRG